MINCPVCSFTMTQYEDKDSILNYVEVCHMCGSIWVDGSTINKILLLPNLPDNIEIKKIFTNDDALVKEGERICPVCYEQLYVVEKLGISVDQCKTCKGILFDHRELKEVWTKSRWESTKTQLKETLTESASLKTKKDKSSSDTYSLSSLDGTWEKFAKWFDENINKTVK